MKLSIIIPVYNEKDTLPKILEKVKQVNLGNIKKEIIIIDDCSTDGTIEVIKNLKDKNLIKIYHEKNRGKGGAVKNGINNSTGDIIIIQDADLEYDPEDYKEVIKPILENKNEVVYGSRMLHKNYRYSHFSFMMGGRMLSMLTNILYFSKLTDEPTCYKCFKANVIKPIKINSERFEWEPEVTAKILKKGIKIKEVPINYYPRSVEEGKKIKWKDGFIALWTLIKYRFSN